MEVSGAPRGDQGSFKEIPKSSKVTIHGVCRVAMSRQGAAGCPQRAPKETLESQNEAQSNPEEFHRGLKTSENDLPIKKVNGHETMQQILKIIVFSCSEDELGAQIFKAFGIRF